MQLGPKLWKEHESFYNSLTLADGDELEQYAAKNIAKTFPNYEGLWKRHVCPATNPLDGNGMDFRPGVADVISLIVQRSYSVLYNLVLARESLAKVQTDAPDRWSQNCYDTIIYAGNALQVLTALQNAVCGKPEKMQGTKDLAEQVGVTIDPFHDWKQNWKADYDSASKYRNYLTHEGHFYTVQDRESGKTLVLNRGGFESKVPFPWKRAGARFKSDPTDWKPLDEVCEEILEESTTFMNRAYGRLLEDLDKQLLNPDYQKALGMAGSSDSTCRDTAGSSQGYGRPSRQVHQERKHVACRALCKGVVTRRSRESRRILGTGLQDNWGFVPNAPKTLLRPRLVLGKNP
jgi:hypothetical protein